VEGEVVEVNKDLPSQLETLNQDPYGAGWIAKVKITDAASLSKLMDYVAYQKQCAAEGH
jgi:glycine cleavage system H protein